MSSSDSEDETYETTPPELRDAAKEVARDVLPTKSRSKYEDAYKNFIEWQKINKAITSENCLLVYFKKLMERYKPSTVWSLYSMVKSSIKLNENIDISVDHKLSATLKNNAIRYECKKSKLFTGEQIKIFLNEAPDFVHLANKVNLIIINYIF